MAKELESNIRFPGVGQSRPKFSVTLSRRHLEKGPLTQPSLSFCRPPTSDAIDSGSINLNSEAVLQHTAVEHSHGDGLKTSMRISQFEPAVISEEFALDLRSTRHTLSAIPDWPTIHTLPSQTGAYRIGKRILDLTVGILITPIILLLIAFISALIALTSGGPVFYRQTRIGQYGRKFKIIKFRTMHARSNKVLHDFLEANPDACYEWSKAHKLREDPRVTALGRFLRKTSLDELPQLWNVMRGEMSLVGPRPIVHAEREKYGDRFVYYTAVLPGITGLWQVSGRCDVDYETRVGLDEQYAQDWNLMADLAILFQTPRAVCRGRGAY
jgi:lipopolysaccharide/colanic/teichoic acid biosynthesis glycosyltransferase